MELTYRKRYSCPESSQPSLITQSPYRPRFPQWYPGLEGCSYPCTPSTEWSLLESAPFTANAPLAWQHERSRVNGEDLNVHRGHMMRGSGGFGQKQGSGIRVAGSREPGQA